MRLAHSLAPRAVALAALALPLLAPLAACDRGAEARRLATADSVAVLNRRLADVEQDARQRDAMAAELAQGARLVTSIDSALAGVKGLDGAARRRASGAATGDPWAGRRDSVLARVDAVKQLLAQSRARVAQLERRNGNLARAGADYRATIAQLQATVERQQRELAALTATTDSLRTAGRQLATERDAVRDTLGTTRDAANTVYYVVGERRDLVARRVVAEEGAKRFLVVGRRTSLVPARTLDPSVFHAADQRRDSVIPLPRPGRPYRVVSRHEAALLVPGARADGTPDGTLRVREPARFWRASRYLIIEQR